MNAGIKNDHEIDFTATCGEHEELAVAILDVIELYRKEQDICFGEILGILEVTRIFYGACLLKEGGSL